MEKTEFNCPICNGTNLKAGCEFSKHKDSATQSSECLDCGAKWVDEFSMKSYDPEEPKTLRFLATVNRTITFVAQKTLKREFFVNLPEMDDPEEAVLTHTHQVLNENLGRADVQFFL